jgi:hypothetical protein
LVAIGVILASVVPGAPTSAAGAAWPATPRIACDKGSEPEVVQGDVPVEDFGNGRAARGYYCNARLVSYVRGGGGFRVERYVDRAGHVCAYYDSTRLLGADVPAQLQSGGLGVYVLDMSDPKRPKRTAILTTPAMLSPHESLRVNQKRGLLVATLGNPAKNAGALDVYDISKDCRTPTLASSTPLGILGHESGFAPDGRTFYTASTGSGIRTVAAVDLTDPTAPSIVWLSPEYNSHGVSISDDGNTLYMADYEAIDGRAGLSILDVSQVQKRLPNPQVKKIASLSWPEVTLPQNATPFVRDGHRYVLETDEFGGENPDAHVGAARIIDVQNPRKPFVVSRLRLEVHNRPGRGFAAHYCSLPGRDNPNIVACGFLHSGLRVFDIRDPRRPREVAYTNFVVPGSWVNEYAGGDEQPGAVYSAPAYDPLRNDIWYTDGLRGFFVVHVNRSSGITRFAKRYVLPGN